MKKKKEKKRRKFSRFRFYFINIFLGVVIFGILSAMLIYAFCTIHTVTVKGNTIYSEQEIQNYVLDDSYSKNTIYAVVKNFIKPREDIPFVERVSVRIKGYDKIEIRVTEKSMIGCIGLADQQFAYFNEDGKVVEISDRQIPKVMQIAGVTLEKAKVGSKVGLDKDQLEFALSLLKTLKKYDIAVSGLSYDEWGQIFVGYQSIYICVGKADYLEEKIMRLQRILPQLEGQEGILHLENWTPDSTDIVFERPKTE